MSFLRTVAVFSAGYVLGARAGRERYEQIKAQTKKLWDSQAVRDGREKAKTAAAQAVRNVAGAAVMNVKNLAASAAGKSQDSDAAQMNGENFPDTPLADEIIVEPLEDFKDRI